MYKVRKSARLQNSEDEYDWDVDVFELRRRNVHFIVPEQNELMLKMMMTLKGEGGSIAKQRISYLVSCPLQIEALLHHIVPAGF